MKMIMAIVQDEDVGEFLDTVRRHNLRATKISSTGGFLRSGNSTVLLGVDDDQVTEVLDVIRATCRTRKQPATTVLVPSDEPAEPFAAHSLDVEVGGANIFVWEIEQYLRV